MKLNRRQLVTGAGSALAARALAQNPAPETDLTKAARDANRNHSETLAKFEVAMATEPAFQFKA
jgi:hypothetical protein